MAYACDPRPRLGPRIASSIFLSPRAFALGRASEKEAGFGTIPRRTDPISGRTFPWCLPTCRHKLGQASSSLGFGEPTSVSHCQRLITDKIPRSL